MKKLTCLILILALALAPAALAESWQDRLSGYTLEQLQELAAACDAEIIRRTTESFDVPIGAYIVGEDIPAGTYRVEIANNSSFVQVYPDYDTYKRDEYSSTFDEVISRDEPVIGKLELEAGNVFRVSGAVKLSLYKGLGW